jgi:hypothetical protein
MKKWKVEIGVVVLLIIAGLGTWWFIATKDSRLANAQYSKLFKYAQRQAIEIAIIEQANKLENYKQQIEKNKNDIPATTIKPVVPQSPIVPIPVPSVNDSTNIK